jgi:hypothetical protein
MNFMILTGIFDTVEVNDQPFRFPELNKFCVFDFPMIKGTSVPKNLKKIS